jgi:hypothetical protein
MDTGRRSAVRLLGGLAVGGLGGCCSSPALRRDAIGAASATVQPLLARDRNALAASDLPAGAIDVHAHFFNASDIDAAGYLAYSVAHSTPDLQDFIIAMQPVVRALSGIASSAQEEYDWLMEANAQPRANALGRMDRRMNDQRGLIEKKLAEEMRRQGVVAEYDKARSKLAAKSGERLAPRLFDESTVHEILEELYNPATRGSKEAPPGFLGTTPAGIIRFVACMLQDRWTNLELYQRQWQPRGVAGVFGAMVNFDYWYCASRSTPRDQMRVMALISKMSGGYMLPLIAYNPLTDVKEPGESLRLLQDAVNQYGFIGVKIYPAMGFKPYGNGNELDPVLLKMFTWCAQRKVSVMAHANRSMGRDDAADDASSPAGWRALMEAMPPGLPARVNLGHLGGDGSEANHSSWTQGFAELMTGSRGDGMYGDLGYWSGLRSCGDNGCKPILRIRDALRTFPRFGKRAMYGSDWFMMVKDEAWQDYPADLARALGMSGLDLRDVFRSNAIACFALDDAARRDRLRAHLGALPSWL